MYNNILIGVLLCLYLKFILANFLTTQSQTSSSIIVAAPAPNVTQKLCPHSTIECRLTRLGPQRHDRQDGRSGLLLPLISLQVELTPLCFTVEDIRQ
jgi:hypothetical protein